MPRSTVLMRQIAIEEDDKAQNWYVNDAAS